MTQNDFNEMNESGENEAFDSQANETQQGETPRYKRWYDYDPVLLQVIELLRNYPTELKSQAEVFLKKVEEQVSKEAIDKFYEMVKPFNGNRWYDKDPVISKTVELLRVVPQDVQRQAANNFVNYLKENGVILAED